MADIDLQQLQALQDQIANLTTKLEQARLEVKKYTNLSGQLSQNAAKARAETQGMGRGLGGLILGSKFRASQRSQAARINASIAKQVAEKRGQIGEGKRKAQAAVREIQSELKLAKERYKSLTALAKSQERAKAITTNITDDSIDLLMKLKEAYDRGLLTEREYEDKRQKIVARI